jgi:hypothetical protein
MIETSSRRRGAKVRSRVLAAAAVALLSGVGCQSGRIDCVQVSDDGNVLLFRDYLYDTTYIANEAGVRRVDVRWPYMLSPDGQWILYCRQTDGSDGFPSFRDGEELVLHYLPNGREYVTPLPLEVALGIRVVELGPCSTSEAHDRSLEQLRAGPVRVVWCGGAEVVVGAGGGYWRWQPGEPVSVEWKKCTATEVARLERFPWRPLVNPCMVGEVPGFVISVPTDGLTAHRVMWVRPDRSTMELVRKNDAPLRIARACGVTVISPLGILLGIVSGGISGAGTPLLVTAMFWGDALQDLGVDLDAVKEAQAQLEATVRERRAGVTTRPVVGTQPALRETEAARNGVWIVE